jgi:hypothetical protein
MSNYTRARLLAVEVLLSEPEALGNDALESDLYILRDNLRATPDVPDQACITGTATELLGQDPCRGV